MSSSSDEQYAPPTAVVEDMEVRRVGLPLAGRALRFFASLLDGVFVTVCLLLLVLVGVAGGAIAGKGGGGMSWLLATAGNPLAFGGTVFLVCLVPILVQCILLATRGQTLGKIAFSIRIVRVDGSPATAGRTVGLRFLLPMAIGLIPVAGPLFRLVDALCIFRASRRCLHDEIAGTIVVQV